MCQSTDSVGGQKFGVYTANAGSKHGWDILGTYQVVIGASHRQPQLWILEQLDDALSQRLTVAGPNQEAIDAFFNHVHDTGDRRGDHR